jgi:hypothetical protein
LHLPVTSDLAAFRNAALASDRLLIELKSPDERYRGRLADFVFDAIERQLAAHGAAPPSYGSSDPFEARLDDQLYRARLLGSGGLALCFGSLEALAEGPSGLGLADSSTLRRWLDVARERSVQLYVPERTAQVPVLDAPRALAGWLPPTSGDGVCWAAIEYEGQSHLLRGALASMWDAPESTVAPALEAFEQANPRARAAAPEAHASVAPASAVRAVVSTPTPAAASRVTPAAPLAASPPAVVAAPEVEVQSEPLASDDQPEPSNAAPTLRESTPGDTKASNEDPGLDAGWSDEALDEPEPNDDAASAAPVNQDVAAAEPQPTVEEPVEAAAHEERETVPPQSDATPVAPSAWPKLPRPAPPQRNVPAQCQSWMQQLRDMSGPKNHATIERTFVSAYAPLCREIAAGTAPASASEVAAAWAEGFAQSYSSAFKRMRTNRPRPRMIWDVMELALRWTTQFRTRSYQLLMVDGMRFDLGGSVNQELSQRLGARARCLDHALLWSGLPSNSASQLKMFIPAPSRPAALELWPGRGVGGEPSVPGIDRLEIGSRPLYRVQGLEEDLKNPGEAAPQRLERLAGMLAARITPWLQSQTAGTLVVVFGDHGFHWQTTATGTTAAQCGGAMPEQVLVQASAWIVNASRPNLH